MELSNKRKRILVIRLSAMGDVAMTAPVLLALSNQYPGLQVTVLTRAFFKPMFQQISNVEVYEADVKGKHKGVLGLYKLYKELKTLDFIAVADLHNVLRSKILKFYFKLSGTSFVQIDKGRADKKALTRTENKIFKPLQTTHERYVAVFNKLGYPIDIAKSPLLSKEKLSDKIVGILGADTKKWIGIAPFAAFKGKMFPLEAMKEVIAELNTSEKYKILLFGGGKREQKMLDEVAGQFNNVINITGKLAFKEELTLISNLDVMVAMDSGNAHLAAMYAIPTITLWGVTHPYAGFTPFKQENNTLLADRDKFPLIPTSIYGNKFPEGYDKAIETISPSSIVAKIEKVLS